MKHAITYAARIHLLCAWHTFNLQYPTKYRQARTTTGEPVPSVSYEDMKRQCTAK